MNTYYQPRIYKAGSFPALHRHDFLMTGLQAVLSVEGKHENEVTLDNHLGRFVVRVPLRYVELTDHPLPRPVRVTSSDAVPVAGKFMALEVEPLHRHEVVCAADLLPYSLTPVAARKALQELRQLNAGIRNRQLARCLNEVLLNPCISISLLTAAASREYHHAYPGGLLVHSMECARHALSSAREFGLPVQEQEVIEVAALLHDIGKTKSFVADHPLTRVPHGSAGLQMLEQALDRLTAADEAVGRILREILECVSMPSDQRNDPKPRGAVIVISADMVSTAMDRSKRCLESAQGSLRNVVTFPKNDLDPQRMKAPVLHV